MSNFNEAENARAWDRIRALEGGIAGQAADVTDPMGAFAPTPIPIGGPPPVRDAMAGPADIPNYVQTTSDPVDAGATSALPTAPADPAAWQSDTAHRVGNRPVIAGVTETGAAAPSVGDSIGSAAASAYDAAGNYLSGPGGVAAAAGLVGPSIGAGLAGLRARQEVMAMPPRPDGPAKVEPYLAYKTAVAPDTTLTGEGQGGGALDSLRDANWKPVGAGGTPRTGAAGTPGYEKEIAAGRQGQREAYGEMKRSKADAAMSEASKVHVVAELTRDAEDAYRYAAKQKLDADEQRANELARHRETTDKLVDEVRNGKVDPDRYYRNMSTVEGIANTASMVLGGMLQGWNGMAENPAAKSIRQRVEDDMHSQQSVIDNKKTAIQARNTTFGQLEKINGDRSLSESQFMIGGLESAKRTIEQRAKELDSPTAWARAKEAIAGIDLELEKENEKWGNASKAAAERKAAAAGARAAAAQKYADERADKARAFSQKDRELSIEENKALHGPGGANAALIKETENEAAGKAAQKSFDSAWDATVGETLGPVTGFMVNHLGARVEPQQEARQKAGVARLISGYKLANNGGTGMNSDKDMEAAIMPLLPKNGDSETTLTWKKARIDEALKANYVTPYLDAQRKSADTGAGMPPSVTRK